MVKLENISLSDQGSSLMHVTYAGRTALLKFRQSAPKCSRYILRCPALSVGDANFLSVSEYKSLVHSLFQV